MAITQIPFQDPVAPPEKPQPEQLGLYDQQDWEQAYRDLDARVPHLLIQLQDDLARSRKREAIWLSVIVHLVLAIVLWNFKFIEKFIPFHTVVVVPLNANRDKDVTFLALPPDAQKLTQKPKTNVMSDKDRVATARHPELDPKELKKLLATPPPGAPGPAGPRIQAAPPQAMAQGAQPSPQQAPQQPATRPQLDSNQQAQLRMPPRPDSKSVFNKYATGMTAGSAIQQATHAAAADRGGGGQGGDFGLDTGAHDRKYGAVDILSDTRGVDFGPYISRIVHTTKDNWDRAIPESVWMGKKGKVVIDFGILKNGSVAQMQVVQSSGDVALDRAAWAGISASNPYPPLPTEFTGPFITLRFTFYYNPDKADLQ